MSKRKQRVRTKHPGVKIIRRARKTGDVYLGRWREPGREGFREISLTALKLTSHEARVAWAVNKSEQLIIEKQHRAGASRALTVAEAVRLYFDWLDNSPGSHRAGPVAAKTRTQYAQAIGEPVVVPEGMPPEPPKPGHFMRWCSEREIRHVDRITPAMLVELHGWICSLRKAEPAKGEGGKGVWVPGREPLKPASINGILRSVRAFLSWLRKHRHLSGVVTSDDITDSLGLVRVDRAAPTFLRQGEIEQLLSAAARHDAKTFRKTRAEHRDNVAGTTPRHAPILPFVRALLLTGCRFNELAGLTWAEVDLHAGEIRLNPLRVKTRVGRTIRLDITPTLWTQLETMKLQAAGAGHVFGPLSRSVAEGARKRLVATFGAPEFTWHDLRRTAGTFLTCAPSIFSAASAYASAKRLGHSVKIAEARYVGQVKVDPLATTLEEAMGIVKPGTRAAQLAKQADAAARGA